MEEQVIKDATSVRITPNISFNGVDLHDLIASIIDNNPKAVANALRARNITVIDESPQALYITVMELILSEGFRSFSDMIWRFVPIQLNAPNYNTSTRPGLMSFHDMLKTIGAASVKKT